MTISLVATPSLTGATVPQTGSDSGAPIIEPVADPSVPDATSKPTKKKAHKSTKKKKKKKAAAPKATASKAKPPKAQASAEDAPGTADDLSSGPVHHVLRKGETLAKVAKKYGTTSAALVELNGIGNARRIKAGTRLLIRSGGGDAADDGGGDSESMPSGLAVAEVPVLSKADRAALIEMAAAEAAEAAKAEADVSLSEKVVDVARKMLDIPYRFGGSSFLGIDCSGYVKKVFNYLDVKLPRSAREQFKEGEVVAKENLAVGDLVFFRTYAKYASHVGIYLGDNTFIHASSGDKKVTVDSMTAPYYVKRFLGARRLVPEVEASESKSVIQEIPSELDPNPPPGAVPKVNPAQ